MYPQVSAVAIVSMILAACVYGWLAFGCNNPLEEERAELKAAHQESAESADLQAKTVQYGLGHAEAFNVVQFEFNGRRYVVAAKLDQDSSVTLLHSEPIEEEEPTE